MLCWNWSLPAASPTMERFRQFSSQEYVGLGVQPPQDRMERLWKRRLCCFFTALMFMVVALVVTGFYNNVLRENAQSSSATTTFLEHTTLPATTEFMDSKFNNTRNFNNISTSEISTDILAIKSNTDSNGETSSETALKTKKTRKMHKVRNNSTFVIPPSEVELILPASVEVSKTSVNVFYESSTKSHVKSKTKKRKLYNSLTNKFEEIIVAETSTEGKQNIKPTKRSPITHDILKEVWKTIQEHPSGAIDEK